MLKPYLLYKDNYYGQPLAKNCTQNFKWPIILFSYLTDQCTSGLVLCSQTAFLYSDGKKGSGTLTKDFLFSQWQQQKILIFSVPEPFSHPNIQEKERSGYARLHLVLISTRSFIFSSH